MGNCCGAPPKTPKPKKGKKPNPFSVEYSRGPTTTSPLTVLTNPTGRDIGSRYELGQELGRGEFGVTYLCTDREGGENLACKSISKKKLRTAVDIEDVREVDIMRHLPHHPNIVTLKDTYEDGVAVHLVMELCEGGELFDRIVARGHYTERAEAGITRTVVEVVQLLGCEFRMIYTAFPPPLPSTSATILNVKFNKTLRDLHQHHALAIKTGLIHDPLVAAELLRASALSNARDLSYARNIFDQIPQPNCFSWNTIIRAFAENDDSPSYPITLFCHMLLQEPVQPNQLTFPSVLKACARAETIREGEQIHAHAVKVGFGEDEFVLTNLVRMYALCGRTQDACRLVENGSISPMNEANIVLYNTMIDGYFRLGMIDDARGLFDGMPNRSLVSWNGMISGYARIGYFKEAMDVFRRMQLESLNPNYVTLVSVLPAISRIGDLEMGKWLHIHAEKNRIKVDDVLGSALVDMYSKCGHIDKAVEVFETLPKRNSITWSTLIGGLAMHGRARDAIDHYQMMERAGVIPSDVVFIGVLNACSHAGLLDEGRAYFDRIVSVYGLSPRIEHYGCMIDMLGRAGLLKEAEELINNMPMEADDVIYKAWLSACKIHGNVEIGASVVNRLMELAPRDGGCNVLMSNFYASLGDWEAVAKVRLRMKELDTRKDPGSSWIIVDGVTHEFVVEDKTHPRSEEIYSALEEMSSKLRAVGYVPETSGVLLNIDEEEKESALIYHSEKIAIAFGLNSTRPRTALHVMENLRVCVDCHSSIKLISKIYGRRIVVRDRNRFHHFEEEIQSAAKETVGLEDSANGQWWLDTIGKTLDEGSSFERVGSRQLAGLFIAAWARKNLRPHIGDVDAVAVACGFGRAIDNKGAVGLRMRVHVRLLCFVNCHLAAHLDQTESRSHRIHVRHCFSTKASCSETKSTSRKACMKPEMQLENGRTGVPKAESSDNVVASRPPATRGLPSASQMSNGLFINILPTQYEDSPLPKSGGRFSTQEKGKSKLVWR